MAIWNSIVSQNYIQNFRRMNKIYDFEIRLWQLQNQIQFVTPIPQEFMSINADYFSADSIQKMWNIYIGMV